MAESRKAGSRDSESTQLASGTAIVIVIRGDALMPIT